MRSPRITHLSWGRLEVEGHAPFKDARLFPGGARKWDWGETGTRHAPGIQPADVGELLGQLQVCQVTLQLLQKRGIHVHVLQTEEAVRVYNELREKELVGGLFHTTC